MNCRFSVALATLVLSFSSLLMSPGVWAFYTDECRNAYYSQSTTPFSGHHSGRGGVLTFRPECAPDVLYSWQPAGEVAAIDLENTFLTGGAGHYLYTFRTPMATFAFGDTQIRIKLKPTVAFKLTPPRTLCGNHASVEEERNTVYVEPGEPGVGYIICSPDVAESWSLKTIGSKLEAQKELGFVRSNRSRADGYYTGPTYERCADSRNIYGYSNINIGMSWDQSFLDSNFANLDQPSAGFPSKIYPESRQISPSEHFSTRVDSYFALSPTEVQTAAAQFGPPVPRERQIGMDSFPLALKGEFMARCRGREQCSIDVDAIRIQTQNQIDVVFASYGANVRGVPADQADRTLLAASYCSRHDNCGYQISGRRLGDPDPTGTNEDFELLYRCGVAATVYKLYMQHPEERAISYIGCPGSPRGLSAAVPVIDSTVVRRYAPKVIYRCGDAAETREIPVLEDTHQIQLICPLPAQPAHIQSVAHPAQRQARPLGRPARRVP